MTITVSSKDAEKIARYMSDLIGSKGLDRIGRKAVNQIGSKVRKETKSLAGIVFGTSAAALSIKAKAASPGSENPQYKLWMARKIPVAKLKAAHRKTKRGSGRTSLVIDTPTAPPIHFRSIRKEGSRFILRKAGTLPERGVGGVFTNAGAAFSDDRYPDLNRLRKEAERDLPNAVADQIKLHMAKRRK